MDLGFTKTEQAAKTAGYGQTTETTFAETVGVVIKATLSMLGVVFLALMIYAGYLWMTARGEEEPVNKAQKIITASIIGLVIVAGAFGATNLIVPRILERTTGKAGGEPAAGGPKVECCSVCGTWAVKCPPKQKLSEADCKAIGGSYLGIVPSEQCN